MLGKKNNNNTIFNTKNYLYFRFFSNSITYTMLLGGRFKTGTRKHKAYLGTNSAQSSQLNKSRPWKRSQQPYMADKMCIPLPVPHPAHIALIIHNRDSESPIPLESENCIGILRFVK
jgi:hypothetical protein